MKQKRTYINPEIQVVEMEATCIICNSNSVRDYDKCDMGSSEADEVYNP